MKVKELIEILSRYNPDLNVRCAIMEYQWCDDDLCEEYIATANMTKDCIRIYKNDLLLGDLDEMVYQR